MKNVPSRSLTGTMFGTRPGATWPSNVVSYDAGACAGCGSGGIFMFAAEETARRFSGFTRRKATVDKTDERPPNTAATRTTW